MRSRRYVDKNGVCLKNEQRACRPFLPKRGCGKAKQSVSLDSMSSAGGERLRQDACSVARGNYTGKTVVYAKDRRRACCPFSRECGCGKAEQREDHSPLSSAGKVQLRQDACSAMRGGSPCRDTLFPINKVRLEQDGCVQEVPGMTHGFHRCGNAEQMSCLDSLPSAGEEHSRQDACSARLGRSPLRDALLGTGKEQLQQDTCLQRREAWQSRVCVLIPCLRLVRSK